MTKNWCYKIIIVDVIFKATYCLYSDWRLFFDFCRLFMFIFISYSFKEIATPIEFWHDVLLLFQNALVYNPKGSDIHLYAQTLKEFAVQQLYSQFVKQEDTYKTSFKKIRKEAIKTRSGTRRLHHSWQQNDCKLSSNSSLSVTNLCHYTAKCLMSSVTPKLGEVTVPDLSLNFSLKSTRLLFNGAVVLVTVSLLHTYGQHHCRRPAKPLLIC